MEQSDVSRQHVPKHKNGDMVTRAIHVAVIGMGILFLVTLTVLLIAKEKPDSLNLHFNVFALLSAASLISNLVAFVFIARVKQRTNVLVWFSVFLLSLAMWAGAEMMIRLGATPAAAIFWSPYTTLGSVIMPISLYMFALSYTNAKRTLSPFTLPVLLGVSTLFLFADAHTQLLTNYSLKAAKSTPWGFVTPTEPAFFMISLWLILLSLAALLLLVRFRSHTIEPTLRRQTKLFVIAIAIPLVGGGITDGILPALNDAVLPPMSVMLLTIMGIVICYGIRKHHFFSFTPDLIASEVLGTINEAVIGLTPDLVLSYSNAGTERLLGLDTKGLSERKLQDLLAEAWTPAELQEKVFDHLKNETFYTLDSVKFMTASGKPITTKLSVTKVVGEGQPYGYLLVLTDISALAQTQALIEQKVVERTTQLHEEQAKLWASIESLKVGFVLVDASGNIIVQNNAMGTIFDLRQPATSINQLGEHLSGIDLQAKSQQVQSSSQPTNISEASMGSKILQIFMGPVTAGESDQKHVIGTVLLVEDVTEAKVAERSKDEFFSIASHELRTPLTSIKGNSSMILDFYKEILKDEQLKEMVDDIHESSTRLIEIVNDFLDMSRLEQGKMVFNNKAFSIDKVIESLIYEMKPIINEKKLTLSTDQKTLGNLPLVWGDSDRVKQILYNLVGNAAKFADSSKGVIGVNAIVDGANIKITIKDNGRGISDENKKFLFHKFQQAESSILTRDTTKGTGLGLYIARVMSEAMGGRVALEETHVGKGSTFSFTLPIATKEQQTSVSKLNTATDVSTGLTVPKAE